MAVVGLLGDEYDECTQLLKLRIEDLGHKAKVINLRRLPTVTTATINYETIICDGYNLFEMSSFYLREMELRDPFFHVTYTIDLWATLLERYLRFATNEIDNVYFVRSILEILALTKRIVNPPRVYSFRRLMPFGFSFLAHRGFLIPPFTTGFAREAKARSFEEQLPVSLDEAMEWDVLSFPKGEEEWLQIWRKKIEGTTYKLIVLGGRSLDYALAVHESTMGGNNGPIEGSNAEPIEGISAEPASRSNAEPVKIKQEDLPPEVEDTAVKAAEAIKAEFAEVDLKYSEKEGKVWVLGVDPSPDISELERVYGLPISGPLAKYLIDAGG
jgi:hypothetical protein